MNYLLFSKCRSFLQRRASWSSVRRVPRYKNGSSLLRTAQSLLFSDCQLTWFWTFGTLPRGRDRVWCYRMLPIAEGCIVDRGEVAIVEWVCLKSCQGARIWWEGRGVSLLFGRLPTAGPAALLLTRNRVGVGGGGCCVLFRRLARCWSILAQIGYFGVLSSASHLRHILSL